MCGLQSGLNELCLWAKTAVLSNGLLPFSPFWQGDFIIRGKIMQA